MRALRLILNAPPRKKIPPAEVYQSFTRGRRSALRPGHSAPGSLGARAARAPGRRRRRWIRRRSGEGSHLHDAARFHRLDLSMAEPESIASKVARQQRRGLAALDAEGRLRQLGGKGVDLAERRLLR